MWEREMIGRRMRDCGGEANEWLIRNGIERTRRENEIFETKCQV
jgi:hypothetical protein